MNLDVVGGKTWQKQMAYAVGMFMLKETLPRIRALDVVIRLKDLKGVADGYCHPVEDRLYVVEVEKGLKLKEFVRTICHEFVHVKQFVKKEMVMSDKVRWKNTSYGYGTAYSRMPWEKEAFRLQEVYTTRVFDEEVI